MNEERYPNIWHYKCVEGDIEYDVEEIDGERFWYRNDILHREAGPAIEGDCYTLYWYYDGVQIDCASQEEFEQLIRLKAFW